MTDNSSGLVILITLLNILVYKLEKLKEAQQTSCLPLSVRQLCRRFTLKEMQLATNNFQRELVIGRGGFGMVYRGIIDSGERVVAIKKLKAMSRQGRKEFQTEIEMLSQFRHSHIAPLVGYCDEREEMILVYEYMPSGTLADHLHKRVKKGDTSLPPLTWEQRLKICVGAAHGLDYLHTGTSIENRVIHRDVKTANILLDEKLEARISDFGLSKIGPANQTFTYVSSHVKSTTGYLDPYYVSNNRLTRKSDVYAFGVVLFEVLCGRRAVDTSLDKEQTNLAGWAQHCFKKGFIDKITDPNIKGVISSDSLNVYVDVAIKCLHYQPKDRPTMAEVVVGLESALTLQRKKAHYPLVEIMPVHLTEDINCLIPEVKDTHQSQVHEYAGEGIKNVSNGWNHGKQSSVRIAFRKRITGLLSVTAQAFSVTNNKSRATNHKRFLPVHPSVRRELLDHKKVLQSSKLKSFTFYELTVATRNFHPTTLIGRGGFGSVFKGWVNDNTFAAAEWGTGLAIAVKRLDDRSVQSDYEWLAEINFLGNLCHPNVVRLIGYSLEKIHRLLVYDYMPHESLDKHLLDIWTNEEKRRPLDWPIRYNIINGIARGILYLHRDSRPTVIHRDLKASNILLDSEMNPRISDIGLARILGESESELSTLCICGTYGYLSPEYAMWGKFSVKSDVYSFGVVLLEIVSGIKNSLFYRLNSHPADLPSHAWRLFQQERYLELLCGTTIGSCDQSEMSRAIQVGLLCVQPSPEDRPSMSMVVSMLTSDVKLPKPKRPAYSPNYFDGYKNSTQGSLPTTGEFTPR
ncbi:hypothetical protein AgCh_002741 [Apium graveolens]